VVGTSANPGIHLQLPRVFGIGLVHAHAYWGASPAVDREKPRGSISIW